MRGSVGQTPGGTQRCPIRESARELAIRDPHARSIDNLNAQAIGALDAELSTVRTNVDALVADLEAAISEADQFVASMAASGSQS